MIPDPLEGRGASVPTLRSRCDAIGVGTKASLDFTRLLRAIVRSGQSGSDPLLEFDICDVRTIRRLFERGGIGDLQQGMSVPPLQEFLGRQFPIHPASAGGSFCYLDCPAGVRRLRRLDDGRRLSRADRIRPEHRRRLRVRDWQRPRQFRVAVLLRVQAERTCVAGHVFCRQARQGWAHGLAGFARGDL